MAGGAEMNAQTGWIDRNGYFHPCERGLHQACARSRFGSTEAELERRRWIKITSIGNSSELIWVMRELDRMTPEQARRLQKMGFDVLEDDVTYG